MSVPPDPKPKYQELLFASMVSGQTFKGMIQFFLDGELLIQVDVQKARELQRLLGEAADAAISDELLVRFLTEKVKMPIEKAIYALRDFREMRQGDKGITNVN
jgi:hypothetical protein